MEEQQREVRVVDVDNSQKQMAPMPVGCQAGAPGRSHRDGYIWLSSEQAPAGA